MTDLLIATAFMWFVIGAVSVVSQLADEDDWGFFTDPAEPYPSSVRVFAYAMAMVIVFICGPFGLWVQFRDD